MRSAFAALFFFLCPAFSKAQLLVRSDHATEVNHIIYLDDNNSTHTKAKMCTITKAGLIIIGAGIATGVTGVAFMAGNLGRKGGHTGNADNAHTGARLFFTGGLLEIIGGGLLIGGGIHDRARKNRLTLVAPQWSEIGIAYRL